MTSSLAARSILAGACFAVLSGCGGPKVQENQQTAAELFAPAGVCNFAAKAPGNTFRRLGGGTWSAIDPDAPVPSYYCSGANETVQLYGDENSSVNVGYRAAGTQAGGSTIELTYVSEGTGPVPNESTNRNVFTTLAETISREAFGGVPPELFRKKLMNLESYYKPGKADAESFDVGKGFIQLTREASPDLHRIKIAVKFFPDVALKLKD